MESCERDDEFVQRHATSRKRQVFEPPLHRRRSVPRIKNPRTRPALSGSRGSASPTPSRKYGPRSISTQQAEPQGSRICAAREVHQDAAFYPHSNDDVLAVGLLLDDATEANGALAVLPGSHRGPIHTHFDAQGSFVGCMRREDIERLDRRRAPLLTLPAGSIHIHHYRLVHWRTNTSPAAASAHQPTARRRRRLIPDTKDSQLSALVRGTPSRVTRRTAGEMPMPPDFRKAYTSIYELQSKADGMM